jgi:hypothetical protein
MHFRLDSSVAIVFLTLGAGLLTAAPAKPGAQAAPRDITCYVVMQEGNSSEGNSLFLKKMGVEPEVLKSFAPSRFSRVGGKFSISVEGSFGYEAGTPVLIERSGKLALYELPLRLRADPPPAPAKTVTVTVLLSELAKSGALVQPAQKAMDKAAASLGWTKGIAWIIELRPAGSGKLKAIVGLVK